MFAVLSENSNVCYNFSEVK